MTRCYRPRLYIICFFRTVKHGGYPNPCHLGLVTGPKGSTMNGMLLYHVQYLHWWRDTMDVGRPAAKSHLWTHGQHSDLHVGGQDNRSLAAAGWSRRSLSMLHQWHGKTQLTATSPHTSSYLYGMHWFRRKQMWCLLTFNFNQWNYAKQWLHNLFLKPYLAINEPLNPRQLALTPAQI